MGLLETASAEVDFSLLLVRPLEVSDHMTTSKVSLVERLESSFLRVEAGTTALEATGWSAVSVREPSQPEETLSIRAPENCSLPILVDINRHFQVVKVGAKHGHSSADLVVGIERVVT